MKKQATTVEQIDFNRLRRDLKKLMEEVDLRLASEFDAFSPRCGSVCNEQLTA